MRSLTHPIGQTAPNPGVMIEGPNAEQLLVERTDVWCFT